jgi:hypothetical protein
MCDVLKPTSVMVVKINDAILASTTLGLLAGEYWLALLDSLAATT